MAEKKIVDLIIKNGEVCTSSRRFKADIAINNEKIVAIGDAATLPEGEKVIDASGKIVIPGVIHTHVHWRDPGGTQKEDFTTGSRCAAAGGITTAFAMTNVMPEPWDAERFESWKEIARPKCIIDYALYGAYGVDSKPEAILDLAKAGAIGIKIFNRLHLRAKYPYLPSLSIVDHGQLYEIFETCAKIGIPITVHPDEADFVKYLVTRDYINKGKINPKAFRECHAKGYEYGYGMVTGAYDCALYSHITGAKLLVLHLGMMKEEGYDVIRDAKAKGWDVHAEMEASALFMTKERAEKQGPNCIISGMSDAKAGWKAMNDGTIDIVVIEHAPHTKEEMEPGRKDMWNSTLGLMGSQEFLPLMLTAVNEGKIPLQNLVKLTSENPAKHFGIYPKKGVIQVGSDADLTIIDLNKKDIIKTENMLSKSAWTNWDGYKIKGMPVYTIVRGTVVMKDGKIVGTPGCGKFVPGILLE
jgi:dihydroorotase (multifunctional complex type)